MNEIKWNYFELSNTIPTDSIGVEFGLRDDGIVVWRKVKWNPCLMKYEPVELE